MSDESISEKHAKPGGHSGGVSFWISDVREIDLSPRDADASRAIDALASRPGIAIVRAPPAGRALEVMLAATLIATAPDVALHGPAMAPLAGSTLVALHRRLGAGGAVRFWLGGSLTATEALAAGLVDGVSASPADLADAWAAAWKAGGAAVEALVLLSRSGAALAPGPARRLERALFSLAFSDEAALQGARRFFQ